MKQAIRRWVLPLVIGFCCALVLGACNKKPQPAVDTTQGYQSLPQATNILAAVQDKKYHEAVAALIKLRDIATTEQQQSEYAVLTREVRDKLLDASITDPKAADALQAFRFMTTGR